MDVVVRCEPSDFILAQTPLFVSVVRGLVVDMPEIYAPNFDITVFNGILGRLLTDSRETGSFTFSSFFVVDAPLEKALLANETSLILSTIICIDDKGMGVEVSF